MAGMALLRRAWPVAAWISSGGSRKRRVPSVNILHLVKQKDNVTLLNKLRPQFKKRLLQSFKILSLKLREPVVFEINVQRPSLISPEKIVENKGLAAPPHAIENNNLI